METFEREWRTIRRELEQVTQEDFQTYRDFPMWKVFIFRKGFDPKDMAYFPENCARCPETMRILDSVPGVTSAAFSRLLPGTHLWPHRCGNTPLRCHLGLVVVDGCALNVGGMVREWSEGKTMAFSAQVLHEAWNRNTQARTVLLFDVHPATVGVRLETLAQPKTAREKLAGRWLTTRYTVRKNWDDVRKSMGLRPVAEDHHH
jgi:aspartyl/asparaginyl beta-hydroxylase (cupin superfamily)